jgi:hypothetical protein
MWSLTILISDHFAGVVTALHISDGNICRVPNNSPPPQIIFYDLSIAQNMQCQVMVSFLNNESVRMLNKVFVV